MCMVTVNRLAENDALRKARGEPTKHFHDIQPNYSHPSVIAARDSVKSSTSAEYTPPLPKSSGNSGLSIRRPNSGSSRKPQRTTRSRAGARKKFQTT
jgi:hypothetical protein